MRVSVKVNSNLSGAWKTPFPKSKDSTIAPSANARPRFTFLFTNKSISARETARFKHAQDRLHFVFS